MNEINSESMPNNIEPEALPAENEPVIDSPGIADAGNQTEPEDEMPSEKSESSDLVSVSDKEESDMTENTEESEETNPPIAEKIIEDEVEQIEEEEQKETKEILDLEQLRIVLDESNNRVLAEIAKINSSINDINARVSTLRKLADMHENIENNLNSQIDEYKENFYKRAVKHILVDFFDIQEHINFNALNSSDDDTKKMLLGYVKKFSKVFKRYGVYVETVLEGDKYDPRIHEPVKAESTDDKSLDETITKVRKTLVYSIDGKVVERVRVNVYQYCEPVSDTLSDETDESSIII